MQPKVDMEEVVIPDSFLGRHALRNWQTKPGLHAPSDSTLGSRGSRVDPNQEQQSTSDTSVRMEPKAFKPWSLGAASPDSAPIKRVRYQVFRCISSDRLLG